MAEEQQTPQQLAYDIKFRMCFEPEFMQRVYQTTQAIVALHNGNADCAEVRYAIAGAGIALHLDDMRRGEVTP